MKLLGGLLVTGGVLLAGTTGLCTGAVILFSLSSIVTQPLEMLYASPLLLIGIVPCAVGVLIVRVGLRMMRRSDED
ncbi:hypothetical protein [Sphingomonas aerophila]|nr:hypothetical protein [Sphingomonas aerophila]